ncbi:hypothetical protein C0989_004408 [Termitomyces sp. Mn162]|nr:hypothetical protein C0989_004408 [Termitomyces sp. Mn162]
MRTGDHDAPKAARGLSLLSPDEKYPALSLRQLSTGVRKLLDQLPSTRLLTTLRSGEEGRATISFSNKGFFDPDGDLDSKFKASELVGRRTENCVESLAAHPDKACHIRELQLEFEDRTQFYDCDPMFGLIDTVLLAATQLEVLKLQFEYDPDEWVNGIALLSALQYVYLGLTTKTLFNNVAGAALFRLKQLLFVTA